MSIHRHTVHGARTAVLMAAAAVIGVLMLACVPLLLAPNPGPRLPEPTCAVVVLPLESKPESDALPSAPPSPSMRPSLPAPKVPDRQSADPAPGPPARPCPTPEHPAAEGKPAPPQQTDLPPQAPAALPSAPPATDSGPAVPSTTGTDRQATGSDAPAVGADCPPQGISVAQPHYPCQARRLSIEGYVSVRFLISRTGSVDKLTILKAEPEGFFEQTVKRTVRRWRFKPAQRNGRPVEIWVKKCIEFKLQDAT